MSKTLKLADGLSLPLSAVTEKLAWLGRTGSGKTYGAMKLAELMLDAGAQIGAIDPVGVWRALRVPASKGGRAFEVVVFGGLYGDLPLEPSKVAGELVADLVVDRGLSFVLDISQFIPAEQQRFLQGFTHRFFHLKKSKPSAVHLFMEECQEYIPENPSGAEADTLGHMQRLWKLGRNFGIGGSLISQRPQEIAKKALNMSGTLFAFQMTGPQERKAIRAWVSDQGIAVDIEGILQKLEVGQPHVESPMFLKLSETVRILPRVTADLSSTPEVTGGAVKVRPLTPIDVEQIKGAMAETIERAKQDDPKELRKQIAEAKRELNALASAAKVNSVPDTAPGKDVPVLTDADRETLATVARYLRNIGAALEAESEALVAEWTVKIDKALGVMLRKFHEDAATVHLNGRQEFEALLERAGFKRIIEKLERVAVAPAVRMSVHPQHQKPETMRAPQTVARSVASRPVGQVAEGLTKAEQRILDAIAWWKGANLDTPTRHQVAFVAGYTVNGHFNNLVGGLRTKGQLDYPPGGGIILTDAGLAAANRVDETPTRDELIDRVLRVIEPSPGKIFTAVVNAGRDLTREELANLSGYTVNGHFNNMVGSLRSLGVIDYPSKGGVTLGQMFEALP